MAKLAALLNRRVKPIDPACGEPAPRRVAVIDEQHCIGCTLCIEACPVDAIVGANKRMHTVLPDWCTGCDLCVAPCPVDCIVMAPLEPALAWTKVDADLARRRYEDRQARLTRASQSGAEQPQVPSSAALPDKQATIAAAIARARARRRGA